MTSQTQASMAMHTEAPARTAFRVEAILALFVGALGGALQAVLLSGSIVQNISFGALFALAFGFFFARRATSPGAGLIWGLAFATLAWIVVPAGLLPMLARTRSGIFLSDARERFP